jgi:hypothetical protein
MGPIEKISKALCQTFNGESDRLFDGLFTLPYEHITNNFEEGKLYYYDKLTITEDGRHIPQVYMWRNWCYQAPYFMENLNNLGFRITEKEI